MMTPTLREILDATLKTVRMTPENYKAIKKSRLLRATEVRRLVCYIGMHYGYTQHKIADFLNIDHSTVNYYQKNGEANYSNDKDFGYKVDSIMSNFDEVSFYHKMTGWIARDKESGDIVLYSEKPDDVDGTWYKDCDFTYYLPKSYFPQVSYEVSPRRCELTLRLK